MKHILITGGAGFIGSHTTLELLNKNYIVTVVDNLSNSSKESLKRVEKLTGKKVSLHIFDIINRELLEKLFKSKKFDVVIHFAGLKAVSESVEEPLSYYDNNLVSTLALCETMQKFGVRQLIFSSSATVYGDPKKVPITEDEPINPTSPYGQTKAMIEQILKDLVSSNRGWQITSLRYFNPIGAHESGQIGEDPNGVPNNLMPFISQVAVGRRPKLMIFGNDYDTPDGTGVRDYIHVVDLALGHISAIDHPAKKNEFAVYNLGTGMGYSVLEVINAFEQASGKRITYVVTKPRMGDVGICYADPTEAEKGLGWRAKKTLEDACVDAWFWQSQNPNGYN
ncbi:MAG TPA: UDP-glucose 4-epimerase GalE [Candidatus Saccharimonadales bacterium]|jgi:UDP-glucose 4-epimerase|nr:UDP-glucose 4-epimerase GalE [Candidatus Saccharimonadales bacterium]